MKVFSERTTSWTVVQPPLPPSPSVPRKSSLMAAKTLSTTSFFVRRPSRVMVVPSCSCRLASAISSSLVAIRISGEGGGEPFSAVGGDCCCCSSLLGDTGFDCCCCLAATSAFFASSLETSLMVARRTVSVLTASALKWRTSARSRRIIASMATPIVRYSTRERTQSWSLVAMKPQAVHGCRSKMQYRSWSTTSARLTTSGQPLPTKAHFSRCRPSRVISDSGAATSSSTAVSGRLSKGQLRLLMIHWRMQLSQKSLEQHLVCSG